ncbi:glutamic acid-rich protein isoform X1 [Capsicum chacoense]
MGAKDLQKKLKKKKNKGGDSQTMKYSVVQNEENIPKVTKEKKRKKKKLDMQNRRSKEEIDECHLSYHKEENFAKLTKEKKRKKKKLDMQNRRNKDEMNKHHLSSHKADESNNADGEKKKSKSSKQKRKSNALAESGGVNQSSEIEDGIGQENTISSEPDNQETRKSRRKKRKGDKRAGKVEGVPKRQKGNLKEDGDIVEKDHTFSTAKDSFPVEREQAEEEEIYELSSGDEDYSKGMRKWVADYYQNRPGLEVLQERIDEFIVDYEAKKEQEKKEKEALAAEDGWTVVVHHKGRKKTTDSETGIAVGSVSQAAVMDNMAKKKNKDVGLDFYRFQKREAKRNEIMVLQSKFEQDKKRIQQLRAARKFRPY